MRTVDAVEAGKTFEELLDRVERGEVLVINRDGEPVARLAPALATDDPRERARRACENLARLSRGISLGGHSIKELIDDGQWRP